MVKWIDIYARNWIVKIVRVWLNNDIECVICVFVHFGLIPLVRSGLKWARSSSCIVTTWSRRLSGICTVREPTSMNNPSSLLFSIRFYPIVMWRSIILCFSLLASFQPWASSIANARPDDPAPITSISKMLLLSKTNLLVVDEKATDNFF